jgi:DNA-binding transcriptional MocR family regulator
MRWVSHLLQRLVLALWRDAEVRRALRRAERTYARRRAALLGALAARGIRANGRSGLNVWIPVAEEGSVLQGMLERGWGLSGGDRFRLRAPPAVRATIATLAPDEAERLADDLAALLGPRARAAVA